MIDTNKKIQVWRTAALVASGIAALTSFVANAELNDDAEATFSSGQPIVAEDVNEHFNALFQAVNDLEAREAVRACGFTPISSTGNLGGISDARDACRMLETCDTGRSHVCTANEVYLLDQAGVQPPSSAYILHPHWDALDLPVDNCGGFTAGDDSRRGMLWLAGAGSSGADPLVSVGCSLGAAVACCE